MQKVQEVGRREVRRLDQAVQRLKVTKPAGALDQRLDFRRADLCTASALAIQRQTPSTNRCYSRPGSSVTATHLHFVADVFVEGRGTANRTGR